MNRRGATAGLSALAAFSAFCLTQAAAQTISVEDLEAQIDARVGQTDQFRDLLDDPDPARRLAALQVMMESGDPTLVRMALEAGVYSPDPAVRQVALEAFFASGPNLDLRVDFVDFSAAEDRQMAAITRFVSVTRGSIDAEGHAVISWKVADFDQQNGCYLLVNPRSCAVRLSGATVSLFIWDGWVILEPSDDGRLVADTLINVQGQRLPAAISLTIVE